MKADNAALTARVKELEKVNAKLCDDVIDYELKIAERDVSPQALETQLAAAEKALDAISTLIGSVEGAYSVTLKGHEGFMPKGKRQDYEGPTVRGVKYEWVDQSGGGFSGDDFHGTVTFVLDDYHLIVDYAS